jgi:hypothetical protein
MLRFQDHFTGRKIPLPIAKAYITCLLLGLEYLHAECRVIHTDMESLAFPSVLAQLKRIDNFRFEARKYHDDFRE